MNIEISLQNTRICSVCSRVLNDEIIPEAANLETDTFSVFTCTTCRSGPLVGGDALLSHAVLDRNRDCVYGIGHDNSAQTTTNLMESQSTATATINNSLVVSAIEDEPGCSSSLLGLQSNLVERYSSVSSPADRTATSESSRHDSLTPQPEEETSDTEEYQPPGLIKRSDSIRGGRGKGRNVTNTLIVGTSRNTSMRTRSGGKPSGTSYSAKINAIYMENGSVINDKKFREKGFKGSNRGKRVGPNNGGRGSKHLSACMNAASNLNTTGQKENMYNNTRSRFGGNKDDYIRTPIVTSINDKFIMEVVNLCLVCGGIGRDIEGAMISCASCSQSFHTYCVSMHNKLNATIIERGWRCLDCTICEGCGSGEDESNLLLCDECDVSYHTYCLDPPLNRIPHGFWRCKWCSSCIRCNKQICPGVDIRRLEGFCEMCYSLRKCPKCQNLYEIGDLMLKCQHCLRWFHGRCEGYSTEEQAENAIENAFRCSLCRPQTFNDASNISVVVDNVMVSKNAADQIQGLQSLRRFLSCGAEFYPTSISRSISYDQDESSDLAEDACDQILASVFSGRGRGGGSLRGPGRRVLKMGIGGFRNPKNRFSIGFPSNLPNEEDAQISVEDENNLTQAGKTRIRRPRRMRKPKLEELYPANIQESFFGFPAVDSKTLAEQSVEEPSLMIEFKKNSCLDFSSYSYSELSEHSAELLRNEQEMDMLDDIPLVDDIGLDIGLENLDFTDLITEGEADTADNVDSIDDVDDIYNVGSTSSIVQNIAAEVFSPSSASSIRTPSRMNEPTPFPVGSLTLSTSSVPLRPQITDDKPKEYQKILAAERLRINFEEDEPLGDKATKAAVLYANVNHHELKEKYPIWTDRIKQINRVWRELNSEKRQEFVEWARKNRANCPTARKRRRRTNSLGNSAQQQTENEIKNNRRGTDSFNLSQQPCYSGNIINDQGIHQNSINASSRVQEPVAQNSAQIASNFIQTTSTFSSTSELDANITNEYQRKTMVLMQELKQEEAKGDQIKRDKRSLAAKQRQLTKLHQTLPPDEVIRQSSELKNVQEEFNSAKKNCQVQQKIVEKCKQRLKEHLKQEQTQHTAQTSYNFSQTDSPMNRHQIQHQQNAGMAMSNQISSYHKDCEHGQTTVGMEHVNLKAPHLPHLQLQPVQLTKSNRGRKRKKPLPIQRSASLGGILFSKLETDVDREVYDAVDNLLNCIEIKSGLNADTFVKQILLQHEHSISPCNTNQSTDVPVKTKKKRQSFVKAQTQLDISSEFDLLQERIKNMLSVLPPLVYSFEQYRQYDKQILKYPHQTGLAENVVSQLTLFGEKNLRITFMPDLYSELETMHNFVDIETLLPPSMTEMCTSVDIEMLLNDEGNQIEKSVGDEQEESDDPADVETIFPFLSINDIGTRKTIKKSCLILGSNGNDSDVPMEPHWSRFDENCYDLECEMDVILTLNYSKLSNEELVDSLRDILGVNKLSVSQFETPPQTPVFPEHQNLQTTSVCINELLCNVEHAFSKMSCKNCDARLSTEKFPSKEILSRKDALSEETTYFCNMNCYFKFIAQNKIPLGVELLEMAERCVDQDTLEHLRQISVDNFAKRINAGLNPHGANEALDILSNLQISGNLLQSANIPKEFLIRSADLPSFLINNGIGQERKKERSEFKWRAHGWAYCDLPLVQSLQRQYDKRFTGIEHLKALSDHLLVDTRRCAFCGQIGDGEQGSVGRLLNVDANEWVHVNCALWSAEVHVTDEGALINIDIALAKSRNAECKLCKKTGASIRCYKLDCANKEMAYHFVCAKQSGGVFIQDRTFFCTNHEIRPEARCERLDALRRIYVQRDENQLLSKIFNHSHPTEMVMRIGSLIFHKVGQLLPEQLKAFTTEAHIFPVGYQIKRIFWSTTNAFERIFYKCSIADNQGRPEFIVELTGLENSFQGQNPSNAWFPILQSISHLREQSDNETLHFFPNQLSGEMLFGFTEPAISKILESLPGIDQLYTYAFKHGGVPIMDVPLAENPSGCARCEPSLRTLVKRKIKPIISNSPKKSNERICENEAIIPREGRSRSASTRFSILATKFDQDMIRAYKASGISEKMLQSPYSNIRSSDSVYLVSQYKEMKKGWHGNIYLARSKIQGLGLYAKKDFDMNQMIIEYIGELIRNEVCEIRQRRYTEQNRGEYMFRIDSDWVIDATMAGGLARYINHSCDPNCGTKILTVNEDRKIVIYANRPIKAGEELTYDYQFDIEEVNKKISCLCGAPNCARWMN